MPLLQYPMSNQFDPYREALVIEQATVWPETLTSAPQDPAAREQIAARLHADPAQAAELEYVRLHAGFQRKITVTAEDWERLEKGSLEETVAVRDNDEVQMTNDERMTKSE
ncbi:MAG: hypothetical protein JXB10_01245 [Pirellulales bacterium]|nr:hypothetical protein [Pirellulales bacterium]